MKNDVRPSSIHAKDTRNEVKVKYRGESSPSSHVSSRWSEKVKKDCRRTVVAVVMLLAALAARLVVKVNTSICIPRKNHC